MKNNSSRGFDPNADYSSDDRDSRYYGVFIKQDDKSLGVDLNRWIELTNPSELVKREILKTGKDEFFHPAKKLRSDYTVNRMLDNLRDVQQRWELYKKTINYVLSGISAKTFIASEDDLLSSGIIDYTEATERASLRNLCSSALAEMEKKDQYISLHEAFFHQMASQIEALFLKAITENGYPGEDFSRRELYSFNVTEEDIKKLDNFYEFEKLYSIWIFLKHNSNSAYKNIKDRFPEVLKEGEFIQGNLACNFIKFDASLFESILNGIKIFITEYCRLVFKENAEEAYWNSEEFFMSCVDECRRALEDPFGIDSLFGE